MTHALLFLALAAAPAPTDAELTAFGKAIAADFAAGRDGITPRFDVEAFMDRVAPANVMTATQRASFAKGVMNSMSKNWPRLAAESASGTQVLHRRNVMLDGLPAVQLRMTSRSQGFNFFELAVARNAKGELRIVDFFDLFVGSIRSADSRVLVATLLKSQQDVLGKLLGRDAALSKDLATLKKMSEAGKPNEAVQLWQSLPERSRQTRAAMNVYLGALNQLEDRAAYEQANLRFLELFPDDPAAAMRALEIALGRGDVAGTLKASASLEQRVGEDATFDLLRANVTATGGQGAAALKHVEHALQLEADSKDAWELRIQLGLQQQRWADVAKWLTAAERQAGLSLDLTTPEFAGFVNSKEGRAWVKAQP
jgi:hypothetical protein